MGKSKPICKHTTSRVLDVTGQDGTYLLIGGKLMIEQALTKLVLPCGLIWLGIAALAVIAWRAKRRSGNGRVAAGG